VKQSNRRILWLTSFGADDGIEGSTDLSESVTRLKAVHVAVNQNLVVYEVWSATSPASQLVGSYLRTMLLLVDDDGQIVHGPEDCGYPLRLAPADDLIVETKDGAVGQTVAVGFSGISDAARGGMVARFEITLPMPEGPPCNDSDEPTDKDGYGCKDYNEFPSECGKYDDNDFTASTLCCACTSQVTEPEDECSGVNGRNCKKIAACAWVGNKKKGKCVGIEEACAVISKKGAKGKKLCRKAGCVFKAKTKTCSAPKVSFAADQISATRQESTTGHSMVAVVGMVAIAVVGMLSIFGIAVYKLGIAHSTGEKRCIREIQVEPISDKMEAITH